MNVHIVRRDHDDDSILSRLARALAMREGWTIGGQVSHSADVNYFGSYIEYAEDYSDFRGTHTAAFFTHLETGTHYKEFWWRLADERIGMRTTCARMYVNHLTGPAAVVRAPIDRAVFCPASNPPRHDVPVVGLSGFVDRRSSRKGEHLVAKLAGSELGGRIVITATGHGWPVPTARRDIAELPAFYQSLDVYLCTATIEGVPIPPLEALACGIPVVIPRGVGMLDDLPDIPGIYRYKAGDYGEMYTAVERACCGDRDWDREQLRAVTESYTCENWIADHEAAFERLLTLPRAGIESDRHGKRGVYYVAYGDPARKCAAGAMQSFREHMPAGIEIALASTTPIGLEDVFVSVADVDIGGRHAKTMIYDLVPSDWQYVLYLDADTEIVGDVSWLYKPLMDGWDMVIAKNPGKYHLARNMKRSDNQDECDYTFGQLGTDELIQLNGGVFAFQRNARTAAFFRAWHVEWNRWGKRDQAALLRALWQYPVKLFVLTNHWNTITRYVQGDPERYTAGILHYPMTARRWRGVVTGRSDSTEAWGAVRQFEQEGVGERK